MHQPATKLGVGAAAFPGALSARGVSEILREIAELLAIEPANRYRSLAYKRGADVVAGLADSDLERLIRSGQLGNVTPVGATIARTVHEIASSGRSTIRDRLRNRYPPGSAELSAVLTPGRIRSLHAALGITTIEELRAAVASGQLRGVRGFGERTERRLIARLQNSM